MKIKGLRDDLGSFWANLEIWHKGSLQQSLPLITSRMCIAFFLLSFFMFQQPATCNMPKLIQKPVCATHTSVCTWTHIHSSFQKTPYNLNKNCSPKNFLRYTCTSSLMNTGILQNIYKAFLLWLSPLWYISIVQYFSVLIAESHIFAHVQKSMIGHRSQY